MVENQKNPTGSMKKYLIFCIVWIIACQPSPKDIQYHEDECAFCRMKISDSKFGAELVTSKGKVYKYDAAECMFRVLNEEKDQEYAYILVTDYAQPKTLINAKEAYFLVSKNQPSPMGGNLSAYSDKSKAIQAQKSKEGDIYNYGQTLQLYEKM